MPQSNSILIVENWIKLSKEQALANALIEESELHNDCIELLIHTSDDDSEAAINWNIIQCLSDGRHIYVMGSLTSGTVLVDTDLIKLLNTMRSNFRVI